MKTSVLIAAMSALSIILVALAGGRDIAHAESSPPQYIVGAGVLRAGVRCDRPPYGFRSADNQIVGIEVEMAKQIAKWTFGDSGKIDLICVTAENRIAQLTSKKVDLLVASTSITPERARVVDFGIPYRWEGSDTLVPRESKIVRIADLANKRLVVLKGTIQAKWVEDNYPSAETLRLNTVSEALLALKQGRADAYLHDEAALTIIAKSDPSLRRLEIPFAVSDAGIAVRKGETEWLNYLNESVNRMKAEMMFSDWIAKWAPPELRELNVKWFSESRPAEDH